MCVRKACANERSVRPNVMLQANEKFYREITEVATVVGWRIQYPGKLADRRTDVKILSSHED